MTLQILVYLFERAEQTNESAIQARGACSPLAKVTWPELIADSNDGRTHRPVLMSSLRPGNRGFGIHPQRKPHCRYDIRMTRRDFIPALVAPAFAQNVKPVYRKGKLKQALCSGVFGRNVPLEDRCKTAAKLGVYGLDLIGPKDWPTLQKYGLIPTMVPGCGTIPEGFNKTEHHARFEPIAHEIIDQCAAAGAPNMIGLTGERRGQDPRKGLDNCVIFLNKIKSHLEDKNITIAVEYLNSKVNHKDYDFDHMAYGVEMCKRVNSPRVKILYDMYHVQIMEGDIIRMMRDNIQYIAHFHTAGNPGRHEMDDTQEMNYKGIAKAIAETGFQGFISHEYQPLRDPLQSLEETLKIFDVA